MTDGSNMLTIAGRVRSRLKANDPCAPFKPRPFIVKQSPHNIVLLTKQVKKQLCHLLIKKRFPELPHQPCQPHLNHFTIEKTQLKSIMDNKVGR